MVCCLGVVQEKLPWKLNDLRSLLDQQLSELITDGMLLPGQLISSLLPSVQQQIALELYLGGYKWDRKSVGMIHSQRMVDALLHPDRVISEQAPAAAAAGSSSTAL